jgi:hypothetical protein
MQMKAMRKSRLGLAIGAALGAATLVPATSFGWGVDVSTGHLATGSGGDTLLFPLYTTANAGTADVPAPASTSFSVTNTSTQTVAAKIRFREQEHSMDVLDFVVVLSAYDKFDFYVQQPVGDARPTMTWTDKSCVIGPAASTAETRTQPFPPPSNFVETDEQMSVGHLEVLGMADLNGVCVSSSGAAASCGGSAIDLGEAATHDADGVPADCDILVKALASSTNVASLNSLYSSTAESVGNVLVGRYVVDNGITLADGFHVGIEGGSDAINIQNSDLGWPDEKITSQTNTPCSSSGNCTAHYAWDTADWDHPHLAEMAGLANFQDALTAANVAGDWSNDVSNDVGVDWVLSFPAKYAYLDKPGSDWWLLSETPDDLGGNSGIWTSKDTKNLCLNTTGVLAYDTEEKESSASVTVSPGARTELDICNELSIFTLAGEAQEVKPSVIQTPDRRQVIRFQNLDATRGWGNIGLAWPTPGDAVTGLIFTTRATTGVLDQNGSITDLQKNVPSPSESSPNGGT